MKADWRLTAMVGVVAVLAFVACGVLLVWLDVKL